MDPKYKIGDLVYIARTTKSRVEITCPVCCGKKVVHVVLGDGTWVEVQCEHCGSRGLNIPTGVITSHWEWEPAVEGPYPVSMVNVEMRDNRGIEITYYYRTSSNTQGGFNEDSACDTYDGAMEIATRYARERNIEEKRHKLEDKDKPTKSYSHNAGYHLEMARKARRDVEYHEKKAKLMEAKSPRKKPDEG